MNGHRREFAELLRDGDWLRGFVATLVPRQDVDDVMQSTWLAALQGGTVTRSARNWMCGARARLTTAAIRATRSPADSRCRR